jgi:hypothetical protein
MAGSRVAILVAAKRSTRSICSIATGCNVLNDSVLGGNELMVQLLIFLVLRHSCSRRSLSMNDVKLRRNYGVGRSRITFLMDRAIKRKRKKSDCSTPTHALIEGQPVRNEWECLHWQTIFSCLWSGFYRTPHDSFINRISRSGSVRLVPRSDQKDHRNQRKI